MSQTLSTPPHSHKKLTPLQWTPPSKPTGSKDAQMQGFEGAENTAEMSSSGDHLLDRTPSQNFHRGSNLALHWDPPFYNICQKQIMHFDCSSVDKNTKKILTTTYNSVQNKKWMDKQPVFSERWFICFRRGPISRLGRRYLELLLLKLQIQVLIFQDFCTAVFYPGNLSEAILIGFLKMKGILGEGMVTKKILLGSIEQSSTRKKQQQTSSAF